MDSRVAAEAFGDIFQYEYVFRHLFLHGEGGVVAEGFYSGFPY